MINKVLYTLKLKKRPDVDRSKVLKAFPLRNQLITWEMDDKGEASLVIPQKGKFWVKLTSKIFMLPDKRVVVLDSIGAFVWERCDGEHTISQIIKALQNKHQLTRKEAETSLFTFIKMLGKRNFIQFAIPTEDNPNELPSQKPAQQKRFGFLSKG